MTKKVVIIGSGFAGLSAACFLANNGLDVTVIEKHNTPGGRARQLKENGFTFDMGPSWYWMPDVFERFFHQFGKKVSDYYKLQRISPSYKVYWKDGVTDIPSDFNEIKNLFESFEKGASSKLDTFIEEAAYKYKTGIQKLVFKPGQSVSEFFDWDIAKGIFRLDVFTSIKRHISKYFSDPKIQQLLEFPILFLGALPENTPALYSLMNYADIIGGTWYPEGGMFSVVNAMHKLAVELGATFHFNENVEKIIVENGIAKKVITSSGEHDADIIIGNADYHFIETKLLPAEYRTYSEKYWDNRLMAPSCLIYYIGLNKRLENIRHHSLFFDADFQKHSTEIYKTKNWPENPLFYVSATSVTDNSVAPEGCENLFFLVPLAASTDNDTEAIREKCFSGIVNRMERHTGQTISDAIVYKKSFGPTDFVYEYNSFKGNAYGLANTLMQTAIFKPSFKSKKIRNLFYTGQLTVPGPGVPPSIISGEVAAKEVIKKYSN
ncbi:MAG TPA: phytoene desaturase family protein [Puia sp.]|nr:phytoene desaturase family protein [Puia sp.]